MEKVSTIFTLVSYIADPCPIESKSELRPCKYRERAGSVRDFPEVGVKECLQCGVVKHSRDLQEKVNYKNSSMHEWKAEYFSGTETPKPQDVSRRIDKIKMRLGSPATVCDVGSGFGEMVAALSTLYTASGIEPENRARQHSASNGFRTYESVDDVRDRNLYFDALTLFHVIEHITNPQEFLKELKSILKPNGLIFIETPNANDALLTKYDLESFQAYTYWSHHPILYTKQALCNLLEMNGLTILEKKGAQRYKLGNHFYWTSQGMPGGHAQWQDLEESPASEAYSEWPIENEINDTLFVVARLG